MGACDDEVISVVKKVGEAGTMVEEEVGEIQIKAHKMVNLCFERQQRNSRVLDD